MLQVFKNEWRNELALLMYLMGEHVVGKVSGQEPGGCGLVLPSGGNVHGYREPLQRDKGKQMGSRSGWYRVSPFHCKNT